MTFKQTWAVPLKDGGKSLGVSLEPGQVLTFVGPNGAGKSALFSWLNSQPSDAPVKRIVAHRRIWLSSSGLEVTASRRDRNSQMLSRADRDFDSRIDGQYEDQRLSGILYDLFGEEAGRNSRFVRRVKADESTEDLDGSPLESISAVMERSGLDLRFMINDSMGFDVVRDSKRYPISAMSDGEKAALLLSAEVFLASENSILLLDEPERHLHRAVSPRLIAALIESRSDCGFVISTHDLDLVDRMNQASNSTYLVKDVEWSDSGEPVGWGLHKLPNEGPLNDSARRAVYGGRQQLLFVEGNEGSWDQAMMSALFPDDSVIPVGGYDNVLSAVDGIRSSKDFHWVSAKGVIDGDARSDEEIGGLRERHIFALPVSEVENLFYLPKVVRAQAQRRADHSGDSWEPLFEAAKQQALQKVNHTNVLEHLAAANAQKMLRRSALSELPCRDGIKKHGEKIPINLESPYPHELEVLRRAVAQEDIETIVKRFSIRDSGFQSAVARALRYPNSNDYQNAVLATVKRDHTLREELRSLVAPNPSS